MFSEAAPPNVDVLLHNMTKENKSDRWDDEYRCAVFYSV